MVEEVDGEWESSLNRSLISLSVKLSRFRNWKSSRRERGDIDIDDFDIVFPEVCGSVE
tara:strand:- start:292 stop:465 length:174 start_codon:yes stop_codon:yes gene_type:complete